MRVGEAAPKGVLGRVDLHRIKESSGSGREHWGCRFKCAIKNASAENYRIVTATLTGTQDVNLEDVGSQTHMHGEELEGMASNLYTALAQDMKGQAFMVLRGVGSTNGIEAWKRIHQKYSPSIPAAALTDIMRAMPPGRVKNHRDLLPKIDEWQVRVDAPSRDHGEQLSDNMRITVFMQRLPGDTGDVVCRSLDAQSR